MKNGAGRQNGNPAIAEDEAMGRDSEHMGGFWVLETADMEESLAWGRKAAIACRAPVEVRQFH